MASSGLRGPFPHTEDGINKNVTCRSPGVYALGYSKNSKFHINYVGRSDSDVKGRLHDHEGTHSQFKFEYYASSKAAFEKECHLYHDFNPPGNKIHPDRPAGKDWECPVCAILD